jgi:hypothetical protein
MAQLVRLLVVELTYICLNHRFDMSVIFTANILSVIVDIPVDSETFLMTDFVNLKIKSDQSFRGAHRNRVCIHDVFRRMSARTCMSTCVS